MTRKTAVWSWVTPDLFKERADGPCKFLQGSFIPDMGIGTLQGIQQSPFCFPRIAVSQSIRRCEVIGPCPCSCPGKAGFKGGVDADEHETGKGVPEEVDFRIAPDAVNENERGGLVSDLRDAEACNRIHPLPGPQPVRG